MFKEEGGFFKKILTSKILEKSTSEKSTGSLNFFATDGTGKAVGRMRFRF